MSLPIAVPLPLVLSTTARAGCAPVASDPPTVTTAAGRGLTRAADLVGVVLVGLVIPFGILLVGLPIALVVRGVLYLLGQL